MQKLINLLPVNHFLWIDLKMILNLDCFEADFSLFSKTRGRLLLKCKSKKMIFIVMNNAQKYYISNFFFSGPSATQKQS